MQQRVDSVRTADGFFDLTVWVPDNGSGPGLLLIQEIYGVSDYIRAVAEDLAGLGYVVAAPDLFWRLQPGYRAAHDDAGLAVVAGDGVPVRRRPGGRGLHPALGVLAALPEVDGGIGIIGFCLGGSVAYLVAAQTPLDAVVSFYGSAVPEQLGVLDQITSPLLFALRGQRPVHPA